MKLRLTILALAGILLAATGWADEPEFRGLWVHNWRPGLLSPAQTDATIRWAKDCNFNALIVQVRRVGDAYYDSAYEPRAGNIEAGADFDPLAYVLRKGRENGQEVHAWVNLYRVWTTSTSKPTDPRHVVNLHPEWLSKDVNGSTTSADGQFLDPGVPEVRQFLVNLISDLVSKYDVDGVMLDYVRYPGKNWGYNDKSVAAFNAKHGRKGKPSPDDPLWGQWRRDQVTTAVQEIRKEIDRVRPGTMLSASTIVWGPCPSDFRKTDAYASVFQDWRLWMEEGLLDANMPMNYKDPSNAKHAAYYSDWLVGMKRWSYGRHAYSGVMVYGNNAAGAAAQIKLARDKGLPGSVGFAFSQVDCAPAVATRLKSAVFQKPASVPLMSWISRKASRE